MKTFPKQLIREYDIVDMFDGGSYMLVKRERLKYSGSGFYEQSLTYRMKYRDELLFVRYSYDDYFEYGYGLECKNFSEFDNNLETPNHFYDIKKIYRIRNAKTKKHNLNESWIDKMETPPSIPDMKNNLVTISDFNEYNLTKLKNMNCQLIWSRPFEDYNITNKEKIDKISYPYKDLKRLRMTEESCIADLAATKMAEWKDEQFNEERNILFDLVKLLPVTENNITVIKCMENILKLKINKRKEEIEKTSMVIANMRDSSEN